MIMATQHGLCARRYSHDAFPVSVGVSFELRIRGAAEGEKGARCAAILTRSDKSCESRTRHGFKATSSGPGRGNPRVLWETERVPGPGPHVFTNT